MARSYTREVYTYLRENSHVGAKLTSGEIASTLDMNLNQASAALDQLTKRGLVEPIGKRGRAIVYEQVRMELAHRFKTARVERSGYERSGGYRVARKALPQIDRGPDLFEGATEAVEAPPQARKAVVAPKPEKPAYEPNFVFPEPPAHDPRPLSIRLREIADEIEAVERAVDGVRNRLGLDD